MEAPDSFKERLRASRIVAVLVVDDAEKAVPLARALLRGGVRAMELTLRTPSALDALKRIIHEVPDMYAGVGTILTPEQIHQVKASNAAFGVSPGFNPRVVEEARKAGLAFAPGVATPSEIESAIELGCRVLKLFPAESLGGITYLKSVSAPYSHLGIEYIPLGGIGIKNLRQYLEFPGVLAIGGSWLATRDLIRAQDWDTISRNCEEAASIAAEVRGT